MHLYLIVIVVALLTFVFGFGLGTDAVDDDPIGDLVLVNDEEGGSYVFLQLEPDKTPHDLRSGSKITLEVREISKRSNGTK